LIKCIAVNYDSLVYIIFLSISWPNLIKRLGAYLGA